MWKEKNIYWCCLVIFSLIFPLTGSVSDSPQERREEKELHVPDKNASSSGNTITDAPTPTTDAPPPIEENCSERERKEVDCATNVECKHLNKECLVCNFNCSCVYGQEVNVTCHPRSECLGEQEVLVTMKCQYCYQTAHWEHSCSGTEDCLAINSPRHMFVSNCTVNSDILCLGERVFKKKLPCNWTSGYKWSTALLLSITFGGFGADRFYLGHWQEGIGKLFSFGGLGVWTIMDVILIAIRYLGPADGSLYI